MQKRFLMHFVENNTLVVYGKNVNDYQNDNGDNVRGQNACYKVGLFSWYQLLFP